MVLQVPELRALGLIYHIDRANFFIQFNRNQECSIFKYSWTETLTKSILNSSELYSITFEHGPG